MSEHAAPGSGWAADPRVRRWAPWVAVGFVVLLWWSPWSTGPTAGAKAVQPELCGPPVCVATTAAPATTDPPRIDPLAGVGPLNPTAAALVGQGYDGRRELARRLAEFTTRYGVTACQAFIGADGAGAWELSTEHGPTHPVPVLAACPWQPNPTLKATPSTTKAG